MAWYVYDGPSGSITLTGRRSFSLHRGVPTLLEGELAERVQRAMDPPRRGREVSVPTNIRAASPAEVAVYQEALERAAESADESDDEDQDDGEVQDDEDQESGDSGEPTSAQVRAWAKAQGIEYPTRGRLSPALIQRYKAAHEG